MQFTHGKSIAPWLRVVRTIRILGKTPRNRLKQVPPETVSFYVIEKSTGNLIKRNAIAALLDRRITNAHGIKRSLMLRAQRRALFEFRNRRARCNKIADSTRSARSIVPSCFFTILLRISPLKIIKFPRNVAFVPRRKPHMFRVTSDWFYRHASETGSCRLLKNWKHRFKPWRSRNSWDGKKDHESTCYYFKLFYRAPLRTVV